MSCATREAPGTSEKGLTTQERQLASFALYMDVMTFIYRRWRRCNRRDFRNSKLPGVKYLAELVEEVVGEACMREVMGVSKAAFDKIVLDLACTGQLCGRKLVTAREQVAVFFSMMCNSLSTRQAAERWQHSPRTISRVFHDVTDGLLHLKNAYILGLKPKTSSCILHSSRRNPFFKHCIGAIDGVHVPVIIPHHLRQQYRDRHGLLSMNSLVAVTFDGFITWVLAGWEGSNHDAMVLKDAQTKGLKIPHGKFVLGDAGYRASSIDILIPFPRVQYHLAEWRKGGRGPMTKEDLFNLRHAQLRATVERVFGMMKHKWKMLRGLPNYAPAFQSKMFVAACIADNLMHAPRTGPPPQVVPSTKRDPFSPLSYCSMEEFRNFIAEQMWVQYTREMQGRDLGDVIDLTRD